MIVVFLKKPPLNTFELSKQNHKAYIVKEDTQKEQKRKQIPITYHAPSQHVQAFTCHYAYYQPKLLLLHSCQEGIFKHVCV